MLRCFARGKVVPKIEKAELTYRGLGETKCMFEQLCRIQALKLQLASMQTVGQRLAAWQSMASPKIASDRKILVFEWLRLVCVGVRLGELGLHGYRSPVC